MKSRYKLWKDGRFVGCWSRKGVLRLMSDPDCNFIGAPIRLFALRAGGARRVDGRLFVWLRQPRP